MPEDVLLSRLTEVFQRVFEDKSLTLTPQTNQDDIPAWDSMSNITLAVEIEACFDIKIKIAEMEALRNIGDLIDLIRSHVPLMAR